jgi:glycosyltransferase involved in cell wall biosynthesis
MGAMTRKTGKETPAGDTVATLSIIIPAFNERGTIIRLLEKIEEVHLMGGLGKEVILVNDCSSDDTEELVLRYILKKPHLLVRYIKHDRNRGKGAALRTGIREASGECLIIQDADLEYDPQEYNLLLKPVLDGVADAVYGSRFMGGSTHRVLLFWHTLGNKFLTLFSNMLTNLNLTDMETGYKLVKTDMARRIVLKEDRFGIEPELTAKISRIPGIRIYEVGISYYGRTYGEGKKVNWKDGLWAIWCIVRYNLLHR